MNKVDPALLNILIKDGLIQAVGPQIDARGRDEPAFAHRPDAADERVLAWLQAGDHRSVIDFVPEYRQYSPEGFFGHYLLMVGAMGGADCTAPGELFSAYESSAGTGQVHVWFDGPFGE